MTHCFTVMCRLFSVFFFEFRDEATTQKTNKKSYEIFLVWQPTQPHQQSSKVQEKTGLFDSDQCKMAIHCLSITNSSSNTKECRNVAITTERFGNQRIVTYEWSRVKKKIKLNRNPIHRDRSVT